MYKTDAMGSICDTHIIIFCCLGMHMGLGGNPYGPAGTGKTESVKALGGLFGRQVLVFNCDEVSKNFDPNKMCTVYVHVQKLSRGLYFVKEMFDRIFAFHFLLVYIFP